MESSRKHLIASLISAALFLLHGQLRAATFDHSVKPGPRDNFTTADFRLWLPDGSGPLKGIIVLVPGFEGNGLGQVDDRQWQQLAGKWNFALVGCFLKGAGYYEADKGSGAALLESIKAFGADSKHPELDNAPLVLWGHSAGGQFNYDFTCWKPDRVIAFVANKGAYYESKPNPRARKVPGLIFAGEKDTPERKTNLTKLFEDNRRDGAFWAFAMEPNAAHEVGKTKEVAYPFFDAAIALRLPKSAAATGKADLLPLVEANGWLGDLETREISRAAQPPKSKAKTAWLPDEQTAKVWQAFVGGAALPAPIAPASIAPASIAPASIAPASIAPASIAKTNLESTPSPAPKSAATPNPAAPLSSTVASSTPTVAVAKVLTLKQPVVFDAVLNGKVVGSVTAPTGSNVKVLSSTGAMALVEYLGNRKSIPTSSINWPAGSL